ncbi:MAG TPA: hypothetical protein VLH39_05325 [Magnetospirillaceae bacterium]|nr:hypothetical protein [Magnetospirillaceae bacterium]
MTATRNTKPALTLGLKRAALYLLGMALLSAFYYVAGNYQGFLAATQLMLLRVISGCSLAALLCGLAGLLNAAIQTIRGVCRPSFWALVGWLACSAAAAALAAAALGVRVFAAGF